MTAEVKGAKTACIDAKHMAKHAVWGGERGDGVIHITKQMDHRNQDLVGENYVCNDAGELALTDEDKMNAWVEHYARLLNVEFEWPSNELPEVPPTAGPLSVCLQPWSIKNSAKWNAARLLAHLAS